MTKRLTDLPNERSDDRARGSQPHIRAAIQRLQAVRAGSARCITCGALAVRVVDSALLPQAMCAQHATAWRGLSREQRDAARVGFAKRALQ